MARLLLDEQLPRLLIPMFVGHEATSVQLHGWGGLKNGELLRAAQHQFDVLVTMDSNLPYQQSVSGLDIAVLLIRARTSRLIDLEPLIPELLALIPDCQPGTVTVLDRRPQRSRLAKSDS